jgi:hypothetical protein
MHSRVLLWERPLVKGDIIAVEEVGADVRRLIGFAGELRIASNVDAAKHDLTPMAIAELTVLDE